MVVEERSVNSKMDVGKVDEMGLISQVVVDFRREVEDVGCKSCISDSITTATIIVDDSD